MINSELLATSLPISFAACFPLKMMCSSLPRTPCNPKARMPSTKISQGFPCPHGFLAQDVHGEPCLLISSRTEVKHSGFACPSVVVIVTKIIATTDAVRS